MGPRLAAIKGAIACLSELPPEVHGVAYSDAQSTISGSNATSSAVTVAHEFLEEARMARTRLGIFPDQPIAIPNPTPRLSDEAIEQQENSAKRKR